MRTLHLVDGRRRDASGPRPLVVELWYPAAEEARGRTYESYSVRDIVPASLIADLDDAAAMSRLETFALRDAPVAEDGAPFPLVLFSHGNGGVRIQSTYLTVALASHGYVVASPDHVGTTLADLLRDLDQLPGTTVQSLVDRPVDLSFIIDHLTAEQGTDEVAASVDLARIGVAGHSFGAVTSLRMLALDPRVQVAVPQAPAGPLLAWAGIDRPLNSLQAPVLLQVAGLDDTLPEDAHARTLWAEMGGTRWYTRFATAGHFTFSDLCVLDLPALRAVEGIDVGDVLEDGCGPMNLEARLAYPLIRLSAIALFNAVLRGSVGSLGYIDAERAAQIKPGEVSIERGDGS